MLGTNTALLASLYSEGSQAARGSVEWGAAGIVGGGQSGLPELNQTVAENGSLSSIDRLTLDQFPSSKNQGAHLL